MNSPLRKEHEQDVAVERETKTPQSEPPRATDAVNEAGRPQLVRSETTTETAAALPSDTGEKREVSRNTQAQAQEQEAALFPATELRELQSRWDQIQTGFVDKPREAVHDAEQLVTSAMQKLTDVFADEHSRLERQWNNGNVSTEDLRLAFQRYRTFFRRVLSI